MSILKNLIFTSLITIYLSQYTYTVSASQIIFAGLKSKNWYNIIYNKVNNDPAFSNARIVETNGAKDNYILQQQHPNSMAMLFDFQITNKPYTKILQNKIVSDTVYIAYKGKYQNDMPIKFITLKDSGDELLAQFLVDGIIVLRNPTSSLLLKISSQCQKSQCVIKTFEKQNNLPSVIEQTSQEFKKQNIFLFTLNKSEMATKIILNQLSLVGYKYEEAGELDVFLVKRNV
jgi:hypothetical protein